MRSLILLKYFDKFDGQRKVTLPISLRKFHRHLASVDVACFCFVVELIAISKISKKNIKEKREKTITYIYIENKNKMCSAFPGFFLILI